MTNANTSPHQRLALPAASRRRVLWPSLLAVLLATPQWAAAATSNVPATLGSASAASVIRAPAQRQVSASDFGPMRARSIGPAGMSGRVSAVAVNLKDPTIMYVGAATGGVWRSRDGGLEWQPVFDDQPVLGIGAVAVSESNPDVVWVGTGEGNPRNSAGVGAGVYRSLDGGDTWRHMGLAESERIHRVLIHPQDPRTVYVGAMGPAWSDGDQRGVYKTTDGGETWDRVLYVDEGTGAADLVMDPSNPDKLFAAMWSFRRWPWFFRSGGPGSGLFATRDGGGAWTRLGPEHGLPEGDLGRIGVAVSRSDPDVVYALVEAERSELLRSDDGGASWRTANDRRGIAPRPFYYADIRVDPANENRIYSLHGTIQVSEDAGRSFRTVVPSRIVHGDIHELWIHPDDGRFMILGEDGGIAVTRDRGASWRFVENLPLAQFYHVNVDMAMPFNVYGGLQDNGSWFGPSTVWAQRGIMNLHWTRVGSGDGFATLPDFRDERYGYSMSQQGNLMRFDKTTGARRDIKPVHPAGTTLRFSWNAALNVDPFDSATIYLGSQFVHRSRDDGATWEIVSPDLTTDDPEKQRQEQSGGLSLDATGAENHTTILSIAPSPVERGLIWVSTDDGNIQVTRDDGATWTNVGDRVPDVPPATWAPHVEPSKHDPASAYLIYDDHRRGNWTPYVYRTEDYGRSWRSLATGDVRGFVHVIEEDPVEPNLLFLGTEFGLFASLDRGASWAAWANGVPPAPVRALVVHPRDHDLVVGTHGRAAYVIDDVRPLRALAADPSVAADPLRIFPAAPAVQYVEAEAQGYRSTGHAMFMGDLRPFGALIHYWMAEGGDGREESGGATGGATAGPDADRASLGAVEDELPGAGARARVVVLDASGAELRVLRGSADRGLNRVVWDLRMAMPGDVAARGGAAEPMQVGPGPESPPGPWVLPGSYRVRVEVADRSAEGIVEVVADPRLDVSGADRRLRLDAQLEAARWSRAVARASRRLSDMTAAVERVLASLSPGDDTAELRRQGEDLSRELADLNRRLFAGPECQGICRGATLAARVRAPLRKLNSAHGAPSATDRLAMAQAAEALAELEAALADVMSGPVEAYRRALAAAGFDPLPGGEGPP